MAAHNEFGKWGEDVAEGYLREKGYIILDRDWMYEHKDIDIVAYSTKSSTLICVEVKTRKNEDIAFAVQAFNRQKEKNLIHAVNAYLRTHNHPFENIRFDLITIIGNHRKYQIEHYKDVIQPGNQHAYRRI